MRFAYIAVKAGVGLTKFIFGGYTMDRVTPSYDYWKSPNHTVNRTTMQNGQIKVHNSGTN